MKILIATVSISLNWVKKEMVEAIKNLEIDGHIVDWIILTEQLEDSELYTHSQWTAGKTVAYNLNKAREFALKNGYDYMFIVESDIIPPENALVLMFECNADIVTGIAAERVSKIGKNILNIYYNTPTEQMQEVERLVRKREPFKTSNPHIARSCFLVSRRALKEYPFTSNDHVWFGAVMERGFNVIVDPRVKCSHVDRDGSIMHPIIK